ncbi:MAG: ion transporter [Clostridia bacterium]|nr:ion transporter [Clostridia bacterium]
MGTSKLTQSKKDSFKKRVFEVIQISNVSDTPSRLFDDVLIVVILVNIVLMFLETFDRFEPYRGLIDALEAVTIGFFCIEYALRIWTADKLYPEEKSHAAAAWRFIRSFDGIVELLTILPFFFLSGFVVFRMLRVVRILHLFRINQAFDSFNVITSVLYDKRNQIASSCFIIVVLMLASSLCMYSAEHEAQPAAFQNAFSGIWWSMSTIFTVGYGDISPITTVGRLMGIVISFLGVGVVAIPTGIISAGFVERYTEMQASEESHDLNIHTVIVDMDSKWIGKSAKEIEETDGIAILLAKRGSAKIMPSDDYRVAMGDALAVHRINALKDVEKERS